MKSRTALLKRTRRAAGFTLIEIIIVITIIGLIVAWAGNRIFGQADNAQARIAKAKVASLAATLDQYKLDTGKYPSTSDGLRALLQAPAGVSNWTGPYVKNADELKDPWKNDYVYKSPGDSNRPFEITSYGSDGKEGGDGPARDIHSWD